MKEPSIILMEFYWLELSEYFCTQNMKIYILKKKSSLWFSSKTHLLQNDRNGSILIVRIHFSRSRIFLFQLWLLFFLILAPAPFPALYCHFKKYLQYYCVWHQKHTKICLDEGRNEFLFMAASNLTLIQSIIVIQIISAPDHRNNFGSYGSATLTYIVWKYIL